MPERNLTFTIPGEPIAQGRPRFAVVNGHARAFDPAKSRSWKKLIQDYAIAAGAAPMPGPLTLVVEAVFTRPKTSYRKKEPRGREPKTTKPDLSNVIKGIEDALCGVAYLDDAAIVEVRATKLLGAQDEAPFVRVTVRAAEQIWTDTWMEEIPW